MDVHLKVHFHGSMHCTQSNSIFSVLNIYREAITLLRASFKMDVGLPE